MLALGEDSSLPREIFGPRVRSQFGFLDQQPPPLVTPRIMNDRGSVQTCSLQVESERADSTTCVPQHLLIEFCKDLSDFLAQNPKNVAGISCLDGRSQSGSFAPF